MAVLIPQFLSSRQVQHLRGLAHALEPVVLVGKEGVTEACTRQVDETIVRHELIKVRLPAVDRTQRKDMATALSAGVPAHLVAALGRIVILYRRHPEKPRVELPKNPRA